MARTIRPPKPIWASSASVRLDVAKRLKGKRVVVRYSALRDAHALSTITGTLAAVGSVHAGAGGSAAFVAVWPDLIDGQAPEPGFRFSYDAFVSLACVHSIELAPITTTPTRSTP